MPTETETLNIHLEHTPCLAGTVGGVKVEAVRFAHGRTYTKHLECVLQKGQWLKLNNAILLELEKYSTTQEPSQSETGLRTSVTN